MTEVSTLASLTVVSAHQLKPGTVAAVIPKEIRRKLGIDRGTELVVYEAGGEVIMVPLARLKSAGRAQSRAVRTVSLTDSPSSDSAIQKKEKHAAARA